MLQGDIMLLVVCHNETYMPKCFHTCIFSVAVYSCCHTYIRFPPIAKTSIISNLPSPDNKPCRRAMFSLWIEWVCATFSTYLCGQPLCHQIQFFAIRSKTHCNCWVIHAMSVWNPNAINFSNSGETKFMGNKLSSNFSFSSPYL